jgi:hypothetical protein
MTAGLVAWINGHGTSSGKPIHGSAIEKACLSPGFMLAISQVQGRMAETLSGESMHQ